MISVEIYEHDITHDVVFKVKGHAGAVKEGIDPICCSASTYVDQMVETVKGLYEMGWLKGRPRISREEGKAAIVFHPCESFEMIVKYMIRMSVTGFYSLVRRYPQYIQFDNA